MRYLLILMFLVGCGKTAEFSSPILEPSNSIPPLVPEIYNEGIVRARAIYQIDMSNETAMIKLINSLIPNAHAATGTTTVTYVNAASVSFTINITNFGPGSFTGDTLSLGSFSLSSLDDNQLKICNPGGNTKCTQAVIRVYTTGSVSGFVNGSDSVPVYAGSLNPNSAIGLNTTGSVQVQTISIANNKNRLRLSDFTSPTYNVTSDFSNAGSGNYSMNFVVEYVLFP